MEMQKLYLLVPLAPLVGALIAGLFCRVIPRWVAHTVTIAGVAISCLASFLIFRDVMAGNTYNGPVYQWLTSGNYRFEVGFLIDELTVTMMLVVTFVSLMVHIYTIGYMHDDPGYNRFFSYISLFTFSMLMLVMSNNFMQLFFGWEAVGLVSYLLIGFWYRRPTATFANLKAFLVNRVGDFGFILGIGLVLAHFGTLDYAAVFAKAPELADTTLHFFGNGEGVALMTATCILLFIGAMGKSAQVPLHVWLPDSMEGPTPISALIHAATMVTAGIFMVARMSPLYELSDVALSFVMVIGAITAFFMGLLGLVQNDIKRVVAYSTLSQLGVMTVALGASAYAAGIFHLVTHAFFKALLFLAAGSVIIAMHHEQDIRKMGGIRRYMPITYWTSLIGSLALIGFPGFAGFFSKDAIIEAVHLSQRPGAGFAYLALVAGVFVTALYSFRMFFLVFHGRPRMDHHTLEHLHETPAVVTLPLVMLAIPSVLAGAVLVGPMLFGGYFGAAIAVLPANDVLGQLGHHYTGVLGFVAHGVAALPFWLAMAGLATAWYLYLRRPDLPERIRARVSLLHTILVAKYGFDTFNQTVIAGGTRALGGLLWRVGDQRVIDGWLVNGSARSVGLLSGVVRRLQSGYLYQYAFAMIVGLVALLGWFVRG
jgi:NADH-quinone oxidoreductase subunit L